MPRYRLDVEYDGGAYAGWQRQAELATVQAAIERAILSATGEDLYCRLWQRPVITEPHRAGDLPLVAEVEGVLALPLPTHR